MHFWGFLKKIRTGEFGGTLFYKYTALTELS